MTVIAYDGRYVAADKRAVNNGTARTVTKIRAHGGKAMAFSGEYSHGVALMAWFMSGGAPNDYPKPGAPDSNAFLHVFEKGKHVVVYEYGPVPCIYEDPLYASGCGRDAAHAALSLGHSAAKAVEVASMTDVHCGNGVDVIDLWEIAVDQDDGRKDAAPRRSSRPTLV